MTMAWRRRGAAAVAGMVLAGGVLVACSGGDDGPSTVLPAGAGAVVLPGDPDGAVAVAPPSSVDPAPTTDPPATTAVTAPPIVLPRPAPVPVDPRAVEAAVVVGTIEIPRLGLKTDLNEGISLNTIDRGPSHWPGTALPGHIGNVVVAGHRVTKSKPFRHLDRLQVGDEIVFTVDGVRSVYRVTATEVVTPDALRIADQTAEPVATLFACHPPGSARYRYVVRAALEGPPAATS